MLHSLRISRQFIIIRRGRLSWLLRQEEMLHHLMVHKNFEALPDDATGGPLPGAKNSEPLRRCWLCDEESTEHREMWQKLTDEAPF